MIYMINKILNHVNLVNPVKIPNVSNMQKDSRLKEVGAGGAGRAPTEMVISERCHDTSPRRSV